MIVSIFGDFEYGDKDGLENWLAAHATGHKSIQNAARDKGYNPQSVMLNDGPPDEDWFGRHGLTHVVLGRIFLPGTTPNGSILFGDDWATEQGFYNWHALHEAMHARLNAALGVN